MDWSPDGIARSAEELPAWDAAYGRLLDEPPAPALTPEERQALEDAYRQAIGTVRALARALGRPCPIASRAERRAQRGAPPVTPQ